MANKQLQYLPILDNGVYVEHQEDSIFSMVFNVVNVRENSYDITVESFIDIRKENNPTYYYDAFFTEGQSWMLPDLSVQRKTTNGLI